MKTPVNRRTQCGGWPGAKGSPRNVRTLGLRTHKEPGQKEGACSDPSRPRRLVNGRRGVFAFLAADFRPPGPKGAQSIPTSPGWPVLFSRFGGPTPGHPESGRCVACPHVRPIPFAPTARSVGLEPGPRLEPAAGLPSAPAWPTERCFPGSGFGPCEPILWAGGSPVHWPEPCCGSGLPDRFPKRRRCGNPSLPVVGRGVGRAGLGPGQPRSRSSCEPGLAVHWGVCVGCGDRRPLGPGVPRPRLPGSRSVRGCPGPGQAGENKNAFSRRDRRDAGKLGPARRQTGGHRRRLRPHGVRFDVVP